MDVGKKLALQAVCAMILLKKTKKEKASDRMDKNMQAAGIVCATESWMRVKHVYYEKIAACLCFGM